MGPLGRQPGTAPPAGPASELTAWEAVTDESFREQLRLWLREAVADLPPFPDHDDWAARRDYDAGWQRRLFEAGYAGLGLPEEYGGRRATMRQQLILLEESARAGAPAHGCNIIGVTHAAPTILSEGTLEQRARLVPGILRGDDIWCQGFSETEAGSDLAALRCRAVRDGDDYVINGHKIWTTHAHVADWCELLVRTDPDAPPHRGITYLALPMAAPGITVRPIRTLAGEREFAEVVFEDVRCPVDLRVGNENDGWRVAMVTFSHERTTTFTAELVRALAMAARLKELAKVVGRGESVAWDDAGLRRDLGRVASQLEAMWAMTRAHVAAASEGRPLGPGALMGKVFVTEAIQRLDEIAARVLSDRALVLDDLDELPASEFVRSRLHHIWLTIAGGTSQIQRNIIAERVLGLPKERPWSS